MKASGRGCGTCKDRRISCDRSLPACLHCIRSNRQCQGYGMRLSWPRVNDRKRAMLGIAPSERKTVGVRNTPLRIINTSIWDIQIHYYLTTLGYDSQPTIPTSLSWTPITSETDYSLLQYFTSNTSNSLTAVSPSEGSPHLRDILIRVALSKGIRSSTAVLQSLLALSSLDRDGLQANAARLKLSALSALAASARAGVEGYEVVSHVAALMLLCCFEIQQASETSNQWLYYISGVKSVLKAASLNSVDCSSDLTTLLYWVSYHDILAEFSLRYWRHRRPKKEILPGDVDILVQLNNTVEFTDTSLLCPGIFGLVSEVFSIGLKSSEGQSREADHKDRRAILERKIRDFSIIPSSKVSSPGAMVICDSKTQELFKLSLLVYLERTLGDSPGQSAKLRKMINKAFSTFSELKALPWRFILLILGCEARSDEDRIVVLDLISRTENSNSVRSLQSMKGTIESLWAQDDLWDQELNYTDKFTAVVSSSEILPSFT